MTDLCPFSRSEEEEGISSSMGSCFTTTAPPAPVRMVWRLWGGEVRWSSGLILHMGLWAISMNLSFSFSFSKSAISFCSTDFSSSSSSVSWRSKRNMLAAATKTYPEQTVSSTNTLKFVFLTGLTKLLNKDFFKTGLFSGHISHTWLFCRDVPTKYSMPVSLEISLQ